MLTMSRRASAGVVIGVVGLSFVLFPFHQPLNGSLFYLPSLLAMLTLGGMWAERTRAEPYLLVAAAVCFLLAVAARTADWTVPWPYGTHFLWHAFNGVVVCLVLRAWIVFVASHQKMAILATPIEALRAEIDQERSASDRLQGESCGE